MIEQTSIPRSGDNLDWDAVQTRSRAMVEAGTHPMIADRLARDAAQNQALRERQLKLAGSVVQVPVAATDKAVVAETVRVGVPDLHA